MTIKDGYRPKTTELPKAEIINFNPSSPGLSATLELRVSIEGQDHNILLPVDTLNDHGLSGPAAVESLRDIQKAIQGMQSAFDTFATLEFSNKMDTLIEVLLQQQNQ